MQCSKKYPYSITSSASNCIETGTSMPSALAVFKLMIGSNLVGRSTGRSAGHPGESGQRAFQFGGTPRPLKKQS